MIAMIGQVSEHLLPRNCRDDACPHVILQGIYSMIHGYLGIHSEHLRWLFWRLLKVLGL